jgi:alpha-glucan,water dikinase
MLWSGVVGAKAYNLAKLRSTLPEWVRVPSSVALPFGVFEAVLKDPANAGPAAQLKQLQADLGNARVRAASCAHNM